MSKFKGILAAVFIFFLSALLAPLAFAGVEITSPSDGETVGGIIPIEVSYSGTDVYYLHCSVAGGYWLQPPGPSGTHTFYWDSTGTPDGTQMTIQVNASDTGASQGLFDVIVVNVNNPPPVIAITSPINGEMIPPDSLNLLITVEYHNVLPNYHGIKWISLTMDGTQIRGYRVPGYPTSGTYTWEVDITNLSLGEHVLQAYCADASDMRWSYSEEINIIIGEPPSPPLDPTEEVPQDKITTVAEPINVANGNMFVSYTDVFIPGREIPLQLSRTYNSRDDSEGQFGYGWRSNFDITLTEQPDNSVIEVDEKGVYTIYTKNPDDSYTPSAGKYSELTKNPDGSFMILRKHGRRLFFNAAGRLIKIEERNGNLLDISYGAGGAINEISDSIGRKLTFTADSEGKIIQTKDPADRIFTYEYDSCGNLIKTIDPLGGETLYLYDNSHNIIQIIDANGHSLCFEYDPSDRACHSWQDSGNNEVTLSFDPSNNITSSTDSLGNTTIYEYNGFGLVTRVTDPDGNTRTFTWDEDFNKTSFTDEKNNTAYFTYDFRGNVISAVDPAGNTATFTYEPDFYLVSSATDALSNTSIYSYDEKGNLIETKDALGNATAYIYDSHGDLISVIDARGNNTNYEYDGCGNLIKIIDSLGGATLLSYDLLGNSTATTDAKGSTINFNYDNLNRLSDVIYPDGSKVSYTYDAVGNKTSITGPGGKITSYIYDEVDRLAQIKDASGGITSYAYDTEGNKTAVTDANGSTTSYYYDEMNRLIKTVSPSGKETDFTYDAAGNKTAVTDAKGNTITYNYDVLHRLINKVYPDSSVVEFIYDKVGRVISMTDDQGVTSYDYDALGRLLKVDGPLDNDVISYEYDALGNRMSMTDQDGKKTLYEYDALNRLVKLIDPAGQNTLYTYDGIGNLIEMDYPNGVKSLYTFDSLNRLVSLVNQKAKGHKNILSSYGYDYEPGGMREKATFIDGSYIEYAYDALNRLVKEEMFTARGFLKYSYEYTFDPVGNRLNMRKIPPKLRFWQSYVDCLGAIIRRDLKLRCGLGGRFGDCYGPHCFRPVILTDYTYNSENQLILEEDKLEWGGKLVNLKEAEYVYDDNGNEIEKKLTGGRGKWEREKLTKYEYDYENRLIKITCPKVTQYEYDGAGKRVRAIEGEGVTTYHYDGLSACIERDAEGETTASYVRGLSYGGGIGGIISAKMTASRRRYSNFRTYNIYYHYDGIGDVTALTDRRGRRVASYAYDAYGNVLGQSGIARQNPYNFSTKEYDLASGLCYFGARYYDPRIGRWLTKDPLGMVNGVNLYTYCNNNPVNWIDPWGLCKETATAPFAWWDITSWVLPGTNYGGYSKSGPGEPTSDLDRAFKKHDVLLREAGTGFWNLGNKGVRKAHTELFKDWKHYIDEKRKELWQRFKKKTIDKLIKSPFM